MKTIYPLLLMTLVSSCKYGISPKLAEARNDIRNIKWIIEFDSLQQKCFNRYSYYSDKWKKDGFNVVPLKDSLGWHFLYGYITPGYFTPDSAYTFRKGAVIPEDTGYLSSRIYLLRAVFSIYAAKIEANDNFYQNLKLQYYWRGIYGNEYRVWGIPFFDEHEPGELTKFRIFDFSFDSTGQQLLRTQPYLIDYSQVNLTEGSLTMKTSTPPLAAIYAAFHLLDSFDKVIIEGPRYKISASGIDDTKWRIESI